MSHLSMLEQEGTILDSQAVEILNGFMAGKVTFEDVDGLTKLIENFISRVSKGEDEERPAGVVERAQSTILFLKGVRNSLGLVQ